MEAPAVEKQCIVDCNIVDPDPELKVLWPDLEMDFNVHKKIAYS
jgi:hypothetical protein